MPTKMTRTEQCNTGEPVLHVALQLAEKHWRLAFTTGMGQKPRGRRIEARDLDALAREIANAKRRFKVAEPTRVVSCYEAGMEGSGCTGVLSGHRRIWSVVRVLSVEAEDLRQNDREVTRLGDEARACRNGMRGLLKTQGIRLQRWTNLPAQLAELRLWDVSRLGSELVSRLERMGARLRLIEEQIREVQARRDELMGGTSRAAQKARQLLVLRSLGPNTAWELSTEIFGWRDFSNRRQVGGLLGLAPMPYQSGDTAREGSISKAGRTRLRASVIELAWLWTRYQPASALTRWLQEKYGHGSKRLRRIGIVALARRLVVELWRYLETGALPEGALTKALPAEASSERNDSDKRLVELPVSALGRPRRRPIPEKRQTPEMLGALRAFRIR